MKKYSLIMMLIGLPLAGVSFAGFSVQVPMDVDVGAMHVENFDEIQPVDISEDDDSDRYERDEEYVKYEGIPFIAHTRQVVTAGGEAKKEHKTLGEVKNRIREEMMKPTRQRYYRNFRLEEKVGDRAMRRPGETVQARELRREYNRVLRRAQEDLTFNGQKLLEDLKNKKEERDEKLRELKAKRAEFLSSEESLGDLIRGFNQYLDQARIERQKLDSYKADIDREEATRETYMRHQN